MDCDEINIFHIGDIQLNDTNFYKIIIYGNDGDTPHFHIVDSNSNFQTCICIYSNEYYYHDNIHINYLTENQKNILDNWLRQMDSDFRGITKWELCTIFWKNCENSLIQVPKYKIQPNYMKLKEE